MIIQPYKNFIISLLFLDSSLSANSTNCLSTVKEEQGCSIASILKKSPSIYIREEKLIQKEKKVGLKITEKITSINVIHENQTMIIKRNSVDTQHTCPPFCIQPIRIKNVLTVGELEVLNFIKELKGEEAKLLIDVRKSKEYKNKTIPGAINIPYTMLQNKSKYQKNVLKLLGGKNIGEKWKFKHVATLLIFGNSEETSNASQAIKILLKLSYPNKKILFYRGGIESWNRLGLTTY
jgi:rhodanese-related sulfurtransferase